MRTAYYFKFPFFPLIYFSSRYRALNPINTITVDIGLILSAYSFFNYLFKVSSSKTERSEPLKSREVPLQGCYNK